MKKFEQLDPRIDRGPTRRFAKRLANRAERRQARLKPEEAPKKRCYRGYVS